MKKRLLVLPIMFFVSFCSFSQNVGIGTTTPDASAALDITTTDKGLLIPRMSIASINAIVNPAKGLLVYDSVANQLMANIGTAAAPNFQPVSNSNSSGWNLTGNNGTDPANQFLGTTDNKALRFRVNNIQAGELHPETGNAFWGLRAGSANTTGFSNVAIGAGALKLNTSRSNLVAIGDSALFNNGAGNPFPNEASSNTAIGTKSLFSNTRGRQNTAIGFQSLFSNTLGSDNIAIGQSALFSNDFGLANTGVGSRSLSSNTSGGNNTAVGSFSLLSSTTGNFNTALGSGALQSNTGGSSNIAIGVSAFQNNINGQSNTVIGSFALTATTGSSNNTVVGANVETIFNLGFNNTLIGANSSVNQNGLFNCVAIGESSRNTASSQVRLGNTATTSIGGVVGFTNISDGRFKKNIQEAVKGIDFIMRLRPVTYQLDISGLNKKLNINADGKIDELSKKGIDENEKTIFSGFVAQEVEEAAKSMGYDFSGVDKPKNENDMYGLRYSEFVVPLVKAMQEQQQMINELKNQNADLQKRVLALEKK